MISMAGLGEMSYKIWDRSSTHLPRPIIARPVERPPEQGLSRDISPTLYALLHPHKFSASIYSNTTLCTLEILTFR